MKEFLPCTDKTTFILENELDREEFADFVRFMRKSICLTQSEFASKLGLKTERISKWERGANLPPNKNLLKFIDDIRLLVKEEQSKRRSEQVYYE